VGRRRARGCQDPDYQDAGPGASRERDRGALDCQRPPATPRPALVIAVIAAAVIWSAGEHFGGILTGHATDPNTGSLLVLIAIAFWPRKKIKTMIQNEK
jgi:hypothetical protein